jgi:hypothetical protein
MSTINTYVDDLTLWLISTCTTFVILLGSGALYMIIERLYCKHKYKKR